MIHNYYYDNYDKFLKMISLLCPTRGRPNLALNLYKSFTKTQKFENELMFCLQRDDIKLQEYLDIFLTNNITRYFITDSLQTSYLWNIMALQSKRDFFTLIGDDVEILTKNWDEVIINASKKFEDNIFVITVDDGRKEKRNQKTMRCPHPTVHKKWLKTLGYFVPPFFAHRYIDKYTAELAISLNRYIEIPEIIFNHLKLEINEDETFVRSRKWLGYDQYVYENISKRYFEADLEVLRRNIKF